MALYGTFSFTFLICLHQLDNKAVCVQVKKIVGFVNESRDKLRLLLSAVTFNQNMTIVVIAINVANLVSCIRFDELPSSHYSHKSTLLYSNTLVMLCTNYNESVSDKSRTFLQLIWTIQSHSGTTRKQSAEFSETAQKLPGDYLESVQRIPGE